MVSKASAYVKIYDGETKWMNFWLKLMNFWKNIKIFG